MSHITKVIITVWLWNSCFDLLRRTGHLQGVHPFAPRGSPIRALKRQKYIPRLPSVLNDGAARFVSLVAVYMRGYIVPLLETVYIYIIISISIYLYVYLSIYTYTCKHISYIYLYVCMYVYIYTYIHTHTLIIYIYTHKNTQHTQHTHIYTYIYK